MNAFVRTEGVHAGGHVHAFEVAERWIKELTEVVVFAPGFARTLICERLPGVSFVEMPTIGALENGRIGALLSRAALAFRRAEELAACDVLYATSAGLSDLVPLIVTRQPARVVFMAHVLDRPWHRRGSLPWNVLASLSELVGLLICRLGVQSIITCSNFVSGQLYERGLRQPIYVTTNGVNHLRVAQSSGSRLGALCVARLHPMKGIEDLIRSWGIVSAAIPEATLTIVGDGEPAYRRCLEALCESLGVANRVVFTGTVESLRRDELLADAAVYVFASYEEGWGIAVAEALAAGLPCVTYDLPVFREIFPRGRLSVEPGDVAMFASCVMALLTDEALRCRIAQDARTLSASFTWELAASIERNAIVKTLEAHLRRAASTPRV